MKILDKKSVKQIPVGSIIHIVSINKSDKYLEIKGIVTRNDEVGLGIDKTIALSRICFVGLYEFEIL
ncbi:MAG: hypothetical protein J6M60_06695 [Clostridia bacterium]|nr:hypothetical protein [Clostridia bacterium]